MSELVPLLAATPRLLVLWWSRAYGRQRMAALPDRLLADAGLDRETVEAEAAQPFWRPIGGVTTAPAEAGRTEPQAEAVPATLFDPTKYRRLDFSCTSVHMYQHEIESRTRPDRHPN